MFIQNKYTKWYYNIINKAKFENRIKSKEQYYEKHHIVPKCMGGSDDFNNIVKCRLRVHFILHFLLSKAFPCNRGLITSCLYFKKARNSRLYEIMKKTSFKTND